MRSGKISILLIESDRAIARIDSGDLERSGYTVFAAGTGPEALELMKRHKEIDIVLVDLKPSGEMDGIETAGILLREHNVPFLFRADESFPELLKRSVEIPSCGYTARSGVDSLLISSIESAVGSFRKRISKNRNLERDAELLELFLEFNPSFVFFKDSDIKTLKLSKNYEKMLGMPIEDLLGKTMFELFPSDLAESMDADDKGILARGVPFNVEEKLNGRYYSTTKFPIKRESGESLLAGFTIDISRRVEAEKKLQLEITEHKKARIELDSLRNYLSNIIDSMPSMLIAVDSDCIVTEWNTEARNNTGITSEDAIGVELIRLLPRLTDEHDKVLTAIKSRRKQIIRKKTSRINESNIFEDITIYPLVCNGVNGAVIRLDDVTEKVQLEEMMVQSEKMLSVGGLAAGMAHEINNPLAGMIQTVQVLSNRLWRKMDLPSNVRRAEEAGLDIAELKKYYEILDIPKMIDSLQASGMRIAEIIKNMLSFARKGIGEKIPVNMNSLLDNTLELAATDYDLKRKYDFKQIKIIREFDDNLPDILLESQKVQQVFLNLFRNGSEAMTDAGVENPAFILRTEYNKTENTVVTEIEDSGPGMTEDVKTRIFEPFFTTKPVGSGTGLGLSVSYFIITENHNGEMTVESQPGKGSRFVITLPADI